MSSGEGNGLGLVDGVSLGMGEPGVKLCEGVRGEI